MQVPYVIYPSNWSCAASGKPCCTPRTPQKSPELPLRHGDDVTGPWEGTQPLPCLSLWLQAWCPSSAALPATQRSTRFPEVNHMVKTPNFYFLLFGMFCLFFKRTNLKWDLHPLKWCEALGHCRTVQLALDAVGRLHNPASLSLLSEPCFPAGTWI